ncbi:MAG TPA: hypothetical protein VFI25_00210 [Planctomycetota bacterium]|nr:hypothetical protein [Planctomycetota bacterium]
MSRPSGTGFFVFPIDGGSAGARAAHDVERVRGLAEIEPHLSAGTVASLRPRIGKSRLHVVGLRPAEDEKHWDRVVGGETVLFVRDRTIVAHAAIVHAERSAALASRLFGGAGAGHELLLFLVDATPCAFDLARFNRAAGRAERSAFKSFTTLSASAVRSLEQHFGSIWGFLESAATPPVPPPPTGP